MQPSTQVLRTCVKRAAIVFLLFFAMIPASDGQQTNPAAEFLKQFNLPVGTGQVWEGTITFTQNDHKNKLIHSGTLKHKKEEVDKKSINGSVTIKFCGTGHFHVSSVHRSWSESWEVGKSDEYRETMCSKDDGTGKKEMMPVSPGNEDAKMERGTGKLCPQKEKHKDGSEKEWFNENNYELGPKGANVSMTPVPVKGGYLLKAMAEVFVSYSSNAMSLKTEVCSGKRKSTTMMMSSVPFSQEPQSSASGGEDNKTFLVQAHPVPKKLAFVKHITPADGQETIKGKETLVEEKAEKPGDWNRSLVVTWDLRMKNYCNDVFDALYSDLAVAEAYNDPTLRDRANGDAATYNSLVFQQARQTYYSNNPDQDSNTSIHMSAYKCKEEYETECCEKAREKKEKCCVKGTKEAKKSLRERCLPDIIFDAVYAHERRHVKQCNMDPDMFPPTNVEKLGVYEIDAYMAGIRKYISWLELNCPNDNRLAVAKDRLAALKANRTR